VLFHTGRAKAAADRAHYDARPFLSLPLVQALGACSGAADDGGGAAAN
jgi:hypothetical protein